MKDAAKQKGAARKPATAAKPPKPAKPKAAARPSTATRPAALAGYSGKPTIDKLGVKPGMVVAVLGLESERAFLAELKARAAVAPAVAKGAEMVLMRVDAVSELKRLAALERTIARNGTIWVVWPKGRPALKEDHVRAAALKVGLVDVKVCAFSAGLSALKLVIPVAKR